MQVTVSDTLKGFIDDEVKAGRFESPQQMVESALLGLIEGPPRTETYAELEARVERELTESLEQLERGETYSAEEVWSYVHEQLAALKARKIRGV